MATNGINGSASASSSGNSTSSTNSLESLQVNDFLKLMIIELQNQDPLNPMDNGKILEQIGQLQNITTSQQLNSTLQSVLLGQNLLSSAAMIGRPVKAMTDAGVEIEGVVQSVSVDNTGPRLLVNDQKIQLKNIREVQGF